jgi:1-acyl-sn-glycerol-3-phosphate acyltransferase
MKASDAAHGDRKEWGKMAEHWLSKQSSYQTPEQHASWMARCCPTAVFYSRILGIVYHGSKLAKKGLYDDQGWIQSSLTAVRALESVGGRFDIQGLDILGRLQSPCVFIGNHMSVLETFVLPCLIQPFRDVTFVVKESLITYPFFGHVMRNRNPVVVGRDNPREDLKAVLEDGQRRLEANISVVIFPQTTRSVEFNPKKFNTLGIKLAKRCNVPVVPLALKTDAWGLGRRLKDLGKISPAKTVHIRFGEPMQVEGTGKENHQAVVGFIERNLADWSSSV